MTAITIRDLARRFDRFAALDGISLDIADREFLALLGPSGSGKTTLLRILGGLDFADEGEVLFDGQDMTAVPARERRVGFVFQHYALFRHMTAAENVGFGLRVLPRARRPAARSIGDLDQRIDCGAISDPGYAVRCRAAMDGSTPYRCRAPSWSTSASCSSSPRTAT